MISISNEKITASFTDLGAELLSLKTADGTEYMWQSTNEAFKQTAPVLFPFVSWLHDNAYLYNGKKYELPFLEFAQHKTFAISEQTGSKVVFELTADDSTREMFPFEFLLRVIYEVEVASLNVRFEVENKDEKEMCFGLGWHPTFHVPFEEGLVFDDYHYDFKENCKVRKVIRAGNKFFGGYEPYPLEDDQILRFDNEKLAGVMVLEGTSKKVCICSEKGKKSVDVSFEDMDLLVVFHGKDADFITVEAWSSYMGRADIVEDFGKKEDLIFLKPGEIHKNNWCITCN